jgi:hypothetical protein
MFAQLSVAVAARVGQPNLGRFLILFQGNVSFVFGFHEHSHRDECAIVTGAFTRHSYHRGCRVMGRTAKAG